MMVDFKELLSTEEAAQRIGHKPQTLVMWRSLGRGPAFMKVGRRCFYTATDLQAWLSTCRRVPTDRHAAA